MYILNNGLVYKTRVYKKHNARIRRATQLKIDKRLNRPLTREKRFGEHITHVKNRSPWWSLGKHKVKPYRVPSSGAEVKLPAPRVGEDEDFTRQLH